ncbi:hypothetical protein KBC75_04510 [Candidatus Shapirobacteria bacterium]|nr:hypothetical protein [Candidatus Shapirobacteria bacterium]
MEIAKYLFNLVTIKGRFLGQAFQAMDTSGTSKIIFTRHQANAIEDDVFRLKPYLGKTRTYLRKSLEFWEEGGREFDVAEIPLVRHSGGILVAKPSSSGMSLEMPSSRLYPAIAQWRRMRMYRLEVGEVGKGWACFHAWTDEAKPDLGNSGAPLLSEEKLVVAVASAKVVDPNKPYAGAAEQIAWRFNTR